MVVDVGLASGHQGCGMSTSVARNVSTVYFRHLVTTILVPDAILTLTRLDRPLVFEVYCDRDKGLAGWRA